MDDGAGVEAENGHDDGDVDEDPGGEVGEVGAAEFEEFWHPAVGAEFGGGEWADDDEDEEEEPIAEGSGVEACGDADEGADDERGSEGGGLAKHLHDGEIGEGADDEEADGADLAKHVAVTDTSGDAFVDGELAGENEDAVGNDGDETEGETELPDCVKEEFGVGEEGAEEGAEGEACGPTGVEDVQPFGLLLVEDGGDDRVDEGFNGAVGDGDEEGAPVEGFESGSAEGEDEGDEVAKDCKDGDDFVTDFVDDEGEEDDREGEGPHASAVDIAFLGFGEVEGILEFADGVGAHAEDEGSGDEGDEAGPEELHV